MNSQGNCLQVEILENYNILWRDLRLRDRESYSRNFMIYYFCIFVQHLPWEIFFRKSSEK